MLAEVFEQVAGPVADRSTREAWLREWRLLGIDGFEVDLPDTKGNAEEFGHAGSGDNRSAFPKARVVALAECGTHAFVAAEVGSYSTGEKTLANRLYQRLRPDELLTADRNFYSYDAWGLAAGSGAALLWRAPTGLGLPIVKVLSDGTCLAVLIDPTIRGARRRAAIIEAARAGADLADEPAHLVRATRVRGARPRGQRHRGADRGAVHHHRPRGRPRRRARRRLPPALGVRVEHRDSTCRAARLPIISIQDQPPMNGRRRHMMSWPLRDTRGYSPGVVLAVHNKCELSGSTSMNRRIRSGRKVSGASRGLIAHQPSIPEQWQVRGREGCTRPPP